MLVFVSWSGELSRKVAAVLRDWLPTVLQTIDVWMSTEDISKGSRWTPALAKALETSNVGILCLVPGNVDEPWLNFEAGALSKSLGEGRVFPILFGLDPADLVGPLGQFQATSYSRDDVLKLVRSMNEASEKPISADRIVRIFDLCWPGLQLEMDVLVPEAQNLARALAVEARPESRHEVEELRTQLVAQREELSRSSLALANRVESQHDLLKRIEARLEEKLAVVDVLTARLESGSADAEAVRLMKANRALETELAQDINQLKVVWMHKTLNKGDRVRIASRAGTFKPRETHHEKEIIADSGRTGTMLGGVRRDKSAQRHPDEPIQVALVKWDGQTWTEHASNNKVTLPTFTATIHADYLELM